MSETNCKVKVNNFVSILLTLPSEISVADFNGLAVLVKQLSRPTADVGIVLPATKKRTPQSWTKEEIRVLKECVRAGKSAAEIAKALCTTTKRAYNKILYMKQNKEL